MDAGGDTAYCNQVVAAGDNPTCAQTLQNFQIARVCGTACEGLAATCPFQAANAIGRTIPVPPGNCIFGISSVSADTEVQCAAAFPGAATCVVPSTTIPEGSMLAPCTATGTGPGGPDCSGLAACCSLLVGGVVSTCNEIAAEGDDAICSKYLWSAQQDGYCGGS